MSFSTCNPFARRDSYSMAACNFYRIGSLLPWGLVVAFGIFHSIRLPPDIDDGERVGDQADKHNTLFSQNVTVTGIYWVLLLLSQLGYISQLFSKDGQRVTAAANVAGHYILNNLFVFAWVMLWTRNHLRGAEVILAAHFINQYITYRRYHGLPASIHLPAVAGPYAWTLTALFWNGAIAVDSDSKRAQIAANVFIWVIMVVGGSHVFLLQDHLLGFCLTLLGLSLALKQCDLRLDNLQWIFAWVFFAVFAVESLYALGTKCTGRSTFFRRVGEPDGIATDRERQPLLDDDQAQ